MTGSRRILVVEDEPLISMMLEDFLEALGHSVAGSADHPMSALALIDGGGIDAAILDVNLRGGETCWPVADALVELGIPFLIATGGMDDSVAPRHRGRPLLTKPYTMDGVDKAIDALG